MDSRLYDSSSCISISAARNKEKTGEIRLCVNFKPTLSSCLKDDKYHLPVIKDLLSGLSGNSVFCRLDLIAFDASSQEVTMVNTHLGLFKHTRLPFGAKTTPAIFKSFMDQILNISALKGYQ